MVVSRFVLAVVVTLGTFSFVGCQEENDAKEKKFVGTVPADAPKTSEEALKQQQAMAPDPTKKPGPPSTTTTPPPPNPAK